MAISTPNRHRVNVLAHITRKRENASCFVCPHTLSSTNSLHGLDGNAALLCNQMAMHFSFRNDCIKRMVRNQFSPSPRLYRNLVAENYSPLHISPPFTQYGHSIRLICFQTVATTINESLLLEAERHHKCRDDSHLAREHTIPSDSLPEKKTPDY